MISDHYRMVLYYTHEYVQVKKMRANVFSLALKPAGGNLKLMESKICGNWCAPSMKLISNETLSIVEIRVPVWALGHTGLQKPRFRLYIYRETPYFASVTMLRSATTLLAICAFSTTLAIPNYSCKIYLATTPISTQNVHLSLTVNHASS